MTGRGVRAVVDGSAGSWSVRILDEDGAQVNSVGLLLFGQDDPDDLRPLTSALARMKYRRLSEWRRTATGSLDAEVERF